MITSRRGFLRSLSAGTAAGIAVRCPLTGTSRGATFEPSRPGQDDSFSRSRTHTSVSLWVVRGKCAHSGGHGHAAVSEERHAALKACRGYSKRNVMSPLKRLIEWQDPSHRRSHNSYRVKSLGVTHQE
jgi:hypothetical protein